jgi:hypothetical protein
MAGRKMKPADKPIKAVLAEFLSEQGERLKSKTLDQYKSILDLFQASMNGYAYQTLSKDEAALFDERYNAEGKAHREFCDLFGAEKIPENVGQFLYDFLPRKVMCGKDMLQISGTVIKKLGKWLADNGCVKSDIAEKMADFGTRASKDLPAAETLSRMLDEYADATNVSATESIEGYFYVILVGSTSLGLDDMDGGVTITVPVPRQAAELCRSGWTISGSIGKSARGWRLLEVWNVYAR